MKADERLIDSFEHFVLGDSKNLKMSRIMKVTLSRYVSLGRDRPMRGASWITPRNLHRLSD